MSNGDRHIRIGAFVLHYRFWPQVGQTLDALRGQTRRPDCLVVVDNGSDDGSAGHIARHYPDVEVLQIAENRGPIAGMNVGVTAMLDRGVDAVLMTTHELLLAPDALEMLAARMEEDDAVGAVGPLIGYLDDRDTVFSAGGRLDRKTWEVFHPERGARLSEWRGRPARSVDWVDGSCILLRADAARSVGRFFEEFFFLYDEADFLFRMRDRGWRVECVPAAVAWQDHGELSPYVWVRNKLGLVARNGSRAELARETLRAVYHLARAVPELGDPSRRWEVRAGARGLLDFARGRWGPPPRHLEARWRELRTSNTDQAGRSDHEDREHA